MYVQSRALDMCGERVTGGRYLTAVSGSSERQTELTNLFSRDLNGNIFLSH